MRESQVRAPVQEDHTCWGTAKPVHHSDGACALEPGSRQLLSPCARTTEAWMPWSQALLQERPLQWEAGTLQPRVALCLLQLGKSPHSNKDPAQSKINKIYMHIHIHAEKRPWQLSETF